jgi:tryptophan synthase alpha chain
MNRIEARFAELRARGEKGLVVYLTAGDPSLEETPVLMLEAARAGADVIELGVPWSDPSADGPVIQRAMQRALDRGGAGKDTLGKTLEVVRKLRRESDVPVVLFGYYNPIVQRGVARLAAEAADAGVDGVLVVDLPAEESDELDGALRERALVRVPLLAPTTSVERARTIAARGGGFAYYVALTGVTGAGHLDAGDVARRVGELRPALGALPVAVGFGIKDAASARAVSEHADAVVVGSALVQAISDALDHTARRLATHQLVHALKTAITAR